MSGTVFVLVVGGVFTVYSLIWNWRRRKTSEVVKRMNPSERSYDDEIAAVEKMIAELEEMYSRMQRILARLRLLNQSLQDQKPPDGG